MLGFCDTNPQTVKILKVTEGGGGGSDSRVDPGGGGAKLSPAHPLLPD